MTVFATFALLYMTAQFLEYAETWNYPLFTAAVLLLIVLSLRFGITRITFPIFLTVTTAHFLLVQFPEVANHVNVIVYCNILILLGIVYSMVRRDRYPTDDDCFEMLRPVLQRSTVLVYLLAGFHKLNADFFDPAVSCVGWTLAGLARMARAQTVGVPRGVLLVGGILLVVYLLFCSSPVGRRRLPPLVQAGAAGLILLAAFLLLKWGPAMPATGLAPVVLAMAFLVVIWELVGGALLLVPRLQMPVLAFSWTMHATLALIGFVDFGALAFALLFTFVPRPYFDLLSRRVRLPGSGVAVPRAHPYLAICALSGVCAGLGIRLGAGVLFNAAALVFIWPVLAALPAPARPAWKDVPVHGLLTPRWLYLFPVLLFLHGFTAYLGLRTAGNFSMFSNLRTEGARSNHLVLGGNPLKWWDYQDDAVHFIDIDDPWAEIGHHYQSLEGNRLPVVEFRKLIRQWTEAGRTVPMTFDYGGRTFTTADIANQPAWRASEWDWEMRLMDFRAIQPEGPNACRW